MSTRLMYVLAVIACLLAVYLYKSRDAAPKVAQAQDNYAFWADDIRATQTDALGRAHLQLTAKHLAQDMRTKRLVLDSINAAMLSYPNFEHKAQATPSDTETAQPSMPQSQLTFTAKQAIWQQDGANLEVVGDVHAERWLVGKQAGRADEPFSSPALLNFTTDRLNANTQSKKIWTDTPVRLYADNFSLESQGLQVNLNQGEYELAKPHAHYQPAR